jgi:hypothetical protein
MIETVADILSHWADREAVDSFIAYRKKHKRAALTDRGAMMVAKTLKEIKDAGGDPTEALDMAQEHGWSTIKAEWYFKMRPKPKVAPDTDNRVTKWAEFIRSGKSFLCRDIPSTYAREMVARGIVTEDQCRKAGVVL